MKDFLKTTLAVILGCLIVAVLFVFFTFSVIGVLITGLMSSESEPIMPRSAVLVIDMSSIKVAEQSSPDVPFDMNMSSLMSRRTDSRTTMGIWSLIKAVNTAAEDPSVKFIYLKADSASGEMGGIEELRTALQNFRRSGKAVVSYIEAPSNASYYLASVSDKIFLASYSGGMNMLIGFSGSVMYYKDILDKLGVNIQLIRHGKYKSAGEPYIRNSMSAENREQYEVLYGSMWENWASQIATARDMSLEEFNSLIDGLKLNTPEDFLRYGLVDELVTKSEREQRLCDLYGVNKISKVSTVQIQDYAKIRDNDSKKSKRESIAIIYADGEIYDGRGNTEIMGDTFANIISMARQDSTVKAVVFRVNSPGGSVVASAKIKTEIDLLRKEKPVVASYGSYAASGGYWISNSCDRIFSDANTLTGSIGVFSIIPDFSGTTEKVGIKIEPISSNAHGDMYSGMRALSDEEMGYMQESIEDIYETFTGTVAEGRGLNKNFVDDIGQGRVWTGTDALGIGLVDEIGGLEDALHYAAMLASASHSYDLDLWNIEEYPAPVTMIERIMEMIGQNEALVLAGTPYESVERTFKDITDKDYGKAYALLPYIIEIQ